MKPILTIELFYVLIGAVFAFMAGRIALKRTGARRWGSVLFWGLLGITYIFGKLLSPLLVGYLVLGMVALAALRLVERGEEKGPTKAERVASAERLQNNLFWPALVVPAVVIVVSVLLLFVPVTAFPWVEGKQVTLIALGSGALLALIVALQTLRAPAHTPLVEGGRLLEAIGWALILPQMLAALGAIFAKAGVGTVVACRRSDRQGGRHRPIRYRTDPARIRRKRLAEGRLSAMRSARARARPSPYENGASEDPPAQQESIAVVATGSDQLGRASACENTWSANWVASR